MLVKKSAKHCSRALWASTGISYSGSYFFDNIIETYWNLFLTLPLRSSECWVCSSQLKTNNHDWLFDSLEQRFLFCIHGLSDSCAIWPRHVNYESKCEPLPLFKFTSLSLYRYDVNWHFLQFLVRNITKFAFIIILLHARSDLASEIIQQHLFALIRDYYTVSFHLLHENTNWPISHNEWSFMVINDQPQFQFAGLDILETQ